MPLQKLNGLAQTIAMPGLGLIVFALLDNDEMVEALTSYWSDESFNVRILPRWTWGDEYFLHVEAVNTMAEDWPIDLIAITQETAGLDPTATLPPSAEPSTWQSDVRGTAIVALALKKQLLA